MFRKLKVIIATVMVFLLVLATNLIDQRDYQRISDSTAEIYYDRVVAFELIYDIREEIYAKEVEFLCGLNHHERLSDEMVIEESLMLYERTYMEGEELKLFTELKSSINDLVILEEKVLVKTGDAIQDSISLSELGSKINLTIDQLNSLTHIQMEESRKKVLQTARSVDTVNIFTKIEVIVLIILSLVIVFAIFFSGNSRTKN